MSIKRHGEGVSKITPPTHIAPVFDFSPEVNFEGMNYISGGLFRANGPSSIFFKGFLGTFKEAYKVFSVILCVNDYLPIAILPYSNLYQLYKASTPLKY